MGRLGNLRIARNCRRCGSFCLTTAAARVHCRIGDRRTPCRHCGEECPSARAAYRHCQQRGLQRSPGFVWRGYESIDRRRERIMAEIRSDPAAMAEIRAVAAALVDMMAS